MKAATTAPTTGIQRLAIVAALTPLLLWPCLLNHHPYLFWDSYGYFTQGRSYWAVILAAAGLQPTPPEAAARWIGAAGRMLVFDPAIRSITYSILAWPIAVAGSFWLTATLQAAVAAYTVDLALEKLFGLDRRRRLIVFGVLLVTSSLPWFASFMMPDLFGGLMILALATLALAGPDLALGQRVALTAVAVLAASFHAANLPLALGLTLLVFLLAEPGRRLAAAFRLGSVVLLACLVLAVAGWLAFDRPSLAPKSPPFLLARQIEDGPTLPYLRTHCGDERWALCPHLDAAWSNAQDFLWSPEHSYWAWEELRGRLRAEELPLVIRAALAYPWLQIEASTANALRQLVLLGLDDFVLGRGALIEPQDYWFTYLWDVPVRAHGVGGFSAVIYAGVTLSLVVILWVAWPVQGTAGLRRAGWLLLLAFLLNAAVCGALSGPHARYQGRVAWLLPMLAASLLLRPPGLTHSPAAPGAEDRGPRPALP